MLSMPPALDLLFQGLQRVVGLVLRGQFAAALEKAGRRLRGPLPAISGHDALVKAGADAACTLVLVESGLGGGASEHALRVLAAHRATGSSALHLRADSLRAGALVAWSAGGPWYRLTDRDAFLRSLRRAPASVREIRLGTLVGFGNPVALIESLLEAGRSAQVRLTLDWHDHYLICPAHTLLNTDGDYCNLPDMPVCERCLPQNPALIEAKVRKEGVRLWRARSVQLMLAASEIRVFSASSADLVERAFGEEVARRLQVQPHSMGYFREVLTGPVAFPRDRLRIGIVGHISMHKGSRLVRRLADARRRRALDISFTVIGTLDSAPVADVAVTGSYLTKELPDLLERHSINLVLVPSICPETFCFVAHETIALGLPLAVLDLGAQAEAAASYTRGLVIRDDDPDRLLDACMEFAASGFCRQSQ